MNNLKEISLPFLADAHVHNVEELPSHIHKDKARFSESSWSQSHACRWDGDIDMEETFDGTNTCFFGGVTGPAVVYWKYFGRHFYVYQGGPQWWRDLMKKHDQAIFYGSGVSFSGATPEELLEIVPRKRWGEILEYASGQSYGSHSREYSHNTFDIVVCEDYVTVTNNTSKGEGESLRSSHQFLLDGTDNSKPYRAWKARCYRKAKAEELVEEGKFPTKQEALRFLKSRAIWKWQFVDDTVTVWDVARENFPYVRDYIEELANLDGNDMCNPPWTETDRVIRRSVRAGFDIVDSLFSGRTPCRIVHLARLLSDVLK